jgi:hypothetical protein
MNSYPHRLDIEPLMVSVYVERGPEMKQLRRPLLRLYEVVEAVYAVLGDGRRVEAEDADAGVWLVQFTDQEVAALEDQGYIELAKGPFWISAEVA